MHKRPSIPWLLGQLFLLLASLTISISSLPSSPHGQRLVAFCSLLLRQLCCSIIIILFASKHFCSLGLPHSKTPSLHDQIPSFIFFFTEKRIKENRKPAFRQNALLQDRLFHLRRLRPGRRPPHCSRLCRLPNLGWRCRKRPRRSRGQISCIVFHPSLPS